MPQRVGVEEGEVARGGGRLGEELESACSTKDYLCNLASDGGNLTIIE